MDEKMDNDMDTRLLTSLGSRGLGDHIQAGEAIVDKPLLIKQQ